jgi:hypothetical protein
MGDLGSMADWRVVRDWVVFDARAAEHYRSLRGVDGEWAWYDRGDGGAEVWCKVKRWYRTHALIKFKELGEADSSTLQLTEKMVGRSSLWRVAPDMSTADLDAHASAYGCLRDPANKAKQLRFEIRKAREVAKASGHIRTG